MSDPLTVWRDTFQAGELADEGAQLEFWLGAGVLERTATREEIEQQTRDAASEIQGSC